MKGRLHHAVPGWVPDGETFHIRIRAESPDLVQQASLAHALLSSVEHYQASARWRCRLFLLMPDHLHALISFPREPGMSDTIRAWKTYHARAHDIRWQSGYFDHRLRSEDELSAKAHYIRQNPVVKGLRATPEAWPWTWEPKP